MAATPASPEQELIVPARPVTAQPSRTLQWVLWSALILVIGGLTANFVAQQWRGMQRRDITPMERFNTVPAFTLTERNGQPFGSVQLAGKIWLANFFFTTCPGPCLRMNGKMMEIQQALSRDRANVQLVSFTINPEADTPKVLQHYADRFKALPDRWMFLTGDHDVIYDVAKRGFMLPATTAATDSRQQLSEGEFIHSTRIALVDRQGVVRRYYDSESLEVVQHVLSDVGSLLREQPVAGKK